MDERIAIRKDIRQALAIRYMAEEMHASGHPAVRTIFQPIRKTAFTDDEKPVFVAGLVLQVFHHVQEKRDVFFG